MKGPRRSTGAPSPFEARPKALAPQGDGDRFERAMAKVLCHGLILVIVSKVEAEKMPGPIRKSGVKQVPLSEMTDDYRLENDPRFRSRIEAARASLLAGRGVPLEELPSD